MAKKTLTFKFKKDTKRTYCFEEVPEAGKPELVGSIYVQKHVFGSQPESIKVVISSDNIVEA